MSILPSLGEFYYTSSVRHVILSFSSYPVLYCNGFDQRVAEQQLGNQPQQ
jgi:hypothetical protein